VNPVTFLYLLAGLWGFLLIAAIVFFCFRMERSETVTFGTIVYKTVLPAGHVLYDYDLDLGVSVPISRKDEPDFVLTVRGLDRKGNMRDRNVSVSKAVFYDCNEGDTWAEEADGVHTVIRRKSNQAPHLPRQSS